MGPSRSANFVESILSYREGRLRGRRRFGFAGDLLLRKRIFADFFSVFWEEGPPGLENGLAPRAAFSKPVNDVAHEERKANAQGKVGIGHRESDCHHARVSGTFKCHNHRLASASHRNAGAPTTICRHGEFLCLGQPDVAKFHIPKQWTIGFRRLKKVGCNLLTGEIEGRPPKEERRLRTKPLE